MMCKFLKLNSQDPHLGLLYVSGALDAKGVAHDEVALMRGDPEDFEHVVSSLTFKERYKSFVASWSPGDAPTAQQMDVYLADLERLLFGDLDPSRFCHVAYVHRKGDKTDLHVLVANVERTTGKQFNAAPPGWQRSFDALRDMHNCREGWASPADPALARLVQPGANPLFKAARTREGRVTRASDKEELIAFVMGLLEAGRLPDRKALIQALGQKGHVNRDKNAKFISVLLTGREKPVRLRGAMFEEGFDFAGAARSRPQPGSQPSRPSRTAKDHAADRDPVAEEQARQRFEAAVARRNVDNLQRYKPRRKRALDRQSGPDSQPEHKGFRASTKETGNDASKEESAPAGPAEPTMDLSMDDDPDNFDFARHWEAASADATVGRMAPQLLQALPTFSVTDVPADAGNATKTPNAITDTNANTREDHHEESDRSAFSRVAAALVRDLRERFEQLAQRVVEFGRNIRRERWLHAARFDVARAPNDDAGDTGPQDEGDAVNRPAPRPRSGP